MGPSEPNERDSDSSNTAPPPAKNPVKSSRTVKGGLAAAGQSMSERGTAMIDSVRDGAMADMNRQNPVPSYRKGGSVRKTGLARVHKGEFVVPAKKARKAKRMLKRVRSGR